MMKKSVLPFALVCSALMLNPYVGGQAHAEVQNVQQAKAVKGTVVDETGEPVIGATVLVVGGSASQGTITDMDGNFSINVKPGQKLKITYIGYDESIVAAKEGMKVQMKTSGAVSLNTVEVVAYGVQKKVTMTGAISSVKSEDLVRTSVGSVNNVLGGQLSGVTTVQYSGEPGSDAAEIFVRGKATWGDSQPLIQVDGVERTMADIDPNEIESVTVLKDASATAVFGVRGANGVVLITTKRGSQGKAKISVSTSWTALSPTKMVEQASSLEYANFYNQMSENDYWQTANLAVANGKYSSLEAYMAEKPFSKSFSDAIIQKFATGSDPIRFPNTRWAEYIMKDVTLQQQHNLNISGGTDRVKYFISAGYYSQDGLFKEFGANYDFGYQYHRFNYRSNLDLKATKTTTLSFNVAGNVSNADKPYTGSGAAGLIKQIYYATPFSSPGIIDNKLVYCTTDYTDGLKLPFTGDNGMGYYGKGFMQTNINKIQMDLVLDQKLDFITKGLSFKAKGSYNSAYTINKQGNCQVASYNPLVQYDEQGNVIYNADGTPYIVYRQNGNDTDPSYSASQGKARDWYLEGSFNYSRVFGKHTVNALMLYNQSKQYYYSGSSSYPDVPRSYVGLVGRVTYDYANRYMAEFNIGYNGSENFSPGHKFGFFPSIAAGYLISNENYFSGLNSVVDLLKIKGSYGLIGSDEIGGQRFAFNSEMSWTGGYQFGEMKENWISGIATGRIGNPSISWETAKKLNVGLEMGFFNKLKAQIDFFHEKREGIYIEQESVPSVVGNNIRQWINLGKMQNGGVDASLEYTQNINDFMIQGRANFTFNRNKKLYDDKPTPVWAYREDVGVPLY